MNYPHIKFSRPAISSSLFLLVKTAAKTAARNFSQHRKDRLKREIAARTESAARNGPRILLSQYMDEVNRSNLRSLGNRTTK